MKGIWVQFCKDRGYSLDTFVNEQLPTKGRIETPDDYYDFTKLADYIEWLEEQIDL